MEKMLQHIENTFKGIKFVENTHTYFFNNQKVKKSVSGVVHKFVPFFDKDNIAQRVAVKKGVPIEIVLQEWEDIKNKACEHGTKIHLFGEQYPYNKNLKPSCGKEEAIVKFWNILPDYVVPVKLELQMYHPLYKFCGTADIILYNKELNEFIIGDYKTNKDLFKNYNNQKMLAPFDFLLDNPFNHYQLQLSLYQLLFELTGYKVCRRKLIWLQDNGNFKMYDLKDYTKELIQYLNTFGI